MKAVARPIPSRAANGSFSAGSSELVSLLLYVLKNTTPEDFHDRVLRGIPNMSAGNLSQMLTALQASGVVFGLAVEAVQDRAERHCVRCHKTYLERNNGLQACVVYHIQPELRYTKPGGPPVMHHACCGLQLKPNQKTPPCFLGRHTTVMENVEYNNASVKTCEHRKCTLTPVTTDMIKPWSVLLLLFLLSPLSTDKCRSRTVITRCCAHAVLADLLPPLVPPPLGRPFVLEYPVIVISAPV